MPVRTTLRQQLFAAWSAVIEQDYRAQRVNSERSLQASFWAQLNSILPTTTRRMFIEPRLSICVDGLTKHRYPDIVICNSRNVVAVVELKYLPRTAPRYRKDIETLQLISRNRTGVRVANQRHKGPTRDAREYALGRDVLFVWAGVYRKRQTAARS